jgi:hypothetical protein
LTVTHVSAGESGSAVAGNGNGGTAGGNGGGGGGGVGGEVQKRRGKRNSDYSIESSSLMDMDTTNDFNSSYSEGVTFVGNKRRGSDRDTLRMSWTAGAPAPMPSSQGESWKVGGSVGGGAQNAATSRLYNQEFTQSWTAGSNPGATGGGASAATKDAASSRYNNPQLTQSWTAGSNPGGTGGGGGGSASSGAASAATNDAATLRYNQQLTQSWTAGSNPVPNTSQSSVIPGFISWSAGTNPSNGSIQFNQSWTVAGFTPKNTSQLSHIQFNQLTNNQFSSPATATNSNSYNDWKKIVMQSSRHSGGSPSLDQDQLQNQQAWANGSKQVAYAPQSNGNAYRSPVHSPFAPSQEQQQWSQFHQYHRAQLNRVQEDQQQQPQGHEEGHGQQDQGDGGMTQEDSDLRMFFERFAEQMRDDDSNK